MAFKKQNYEKKLKLRVEVDSFLNQRNSDSIDFLKTNFKEHNKHTQQIILISLMKRDRTFRQKTIKN